MCIRDREVTFGPHDQDSRPVRTAATVRSAEASRGRPRRSARTDSTKPWAAGRAVLRCPLEQRRCRLDVPHKWRVESLNMPRVDEARAQAQVKRLMPCAGDGLLAGQRSASEE